MCMRACVCVFSCKWMPVFVCLCVCLSICLCSLSLTDNWWLENLYSLAFYSMLCSLDHVLLDPTYVSCYSNLHLHWGLIFAIQSLRRWSQPWRGVSTSETQFYIYQYSAWARLLSILVERKGYFRLNSWQLERSFVCKLSVSKQNPSTLMSH